MSEINWGKLRSDYEGGMSLRALAGKYGISKSVIGKHKYEEKWKEPPRTGKKDAGTPQTNPKPPTRDVEAAVRVQAAIKILLEERPSWDEVAARAGYGSRGTAHHAVMRELERCISRDVKELRDQELYMLQRLQARAFKAGIDETNEGWTWATDRFVALSERKSKLMGMDTPVDAAAMANIVVIREVPQGYLGTVEAKHEQ